MRMCVWESGSSHEVGLVSIGSNVLPSLEARVEMLPVRSGRTGRRGWRKGICRRGGEGRG